MTNEVDYDQDGKAMQIDKFRPTSSIFRISFPAYCQQLEDMIEDKMDALKNLRDKAKIFRQSLNDEEAKSRLLQGMRNWA